MGFIKILAGLLISFIFTDNVTVDKNPYLGRRTPLAFMIKYAVIHHTASSANKLSSQLKSVDRYHKQRFEMMSALGWWVGYNWFCDVDGKLIQTRLVGELTAAQQKHNFDCDSICLAGDFNADLPTEAQVKTLRRWLAARPNLTVCFHRDLACRTCPGKRITKKWLRSIASR